jgi:hypothetical protein
MLDLVADGLAIGHLRRADIRLDLELPLEAVDEDVEVKFAHALHDGLTGLEVGLDAEGRVFGGQTLQTLRPSSPGRSSSWARPRSRSPDRGRSSFPERPACCLSHSVSPVVVSFRPASAMMSPAKASSISSRLLECIIIMRPMRSRLPLVEFRTRVALLQLAGIDAGEGQRADEGVVHDLERKAENGCASSARRGDVPGLRSRRRA